MNKSIDRKLAAIMFADIVSYSRMMGANEEMTLKILADFESISIPIVETFKGILIKKNGDEIFCQFDSAKNAVDASLEIQDELSLYNDSRPKDFRLEVRIGIHIGDVVKREDGDIHGDGVNVAARIQPLAAPGGICVSGAVNDALSSHPDYDIISKGKQELKHIVQQHTIFDLKTGHEQKIVIPTETGVIKRLKTPYVLMPVIFILGICGYFFSIYSSNAVKPITNIYIDVTSSGKYIDNYYIDYGYGSYHYYNVDKHLVESIPDSLRDYILESLYQMITSEYANQPFYFDASFSDDESEILNQLYFLKNMELDDNDFTVVKSILSNLSDLLVNRVDYYKRAAPDALLRFFVYNIHDKEKKSNYLIYDKSLSWGETLLEGYSTMAWEEPQFRFSTTAAGIDSLIENIFNNTEKSLRGVLYANIGQTDYVGHVIEILDDDMIKIKQKDPGLIKKKMKLSTDRIYHWANGGAEICIEDLSMVLNYLKNTDPLIIWEERKDEFNLDKYNEIDVRASLSEQIQMISLYKENIQSKLDKGEFDATTTSNNDSFSYTMEVVDIINDIVIAKVVDTKTPKAAFIYRIGDRVRLSK